MIDTRMISRIAGRDIDPSEMDGMWRQTVSGKRVNPLTLTVADISIVDVAHGLAAKNRFGGQTRPLMNVAHHSVLVSQLCDSKLSGLLHDGKEAYTWDMPRPVKDALRLAGVTVFDEIEDHVQRVVCEKFRIPFEVPEDVQRADDMVCCMEGEALFGDMASHRDWSMTSVTHPCVWPACLVPWSPEESVKQFLRAFDLLTRPRRGMIPVRNPEHLVDPSYFDKLTVKKKEGGS